ncbi:hypothetical protein PAPHI01_0285 [Pancytospora philotis]|nr:hypothetical protein PAPHI01_0285 [Pancytospora philotis]
MRCTTKLTCIAQCLATQMWRKAGLLTDSDYELLTRAGSSTPVSDRSVLSESIVAPRSTYEMRSLVDPIRGDEPLKAEGAGTASASGYNREWKEQLCKGYADILRAHVERVYKENSFEKRDGDDSVDPAAFANERAAELKKSLLSPKWLRGSYSYIRSLIHAHNDMYSDFSAVILAVHNTLKKFIDFDEFVKDKDLKHPDPATMEKLNTLRNSLDSASVGHCNPRGFHGRISQRVLEAVAASDVIDDAFIDGIEKYCSDALTYIDEEAPWNISNQIVGNIRRRFPDQPDPFAYLRFVYPEMDYEGWGLFWSAAQRQLGGELKALQKHVDEVKRYRSCDKLESYVKYLVKSIDPVFRGYRIAYRGWPLSREMIDDIITTVAKNFSALSFEDLNKLIANETEADPSDEDVLGTYDMMDTDAFD